MQGVIEAFALEELANAGTECHLAVAVRIPCQPNAGRDGMIVLILESTVLRVNARREAGYAAKVRARRQYDPVTRIAS